MDIKEFEGIWNYFLSIEKDLADTGKYIEPAGQENVYSFEFAKLLILSCTEIESIFKEIGKNKEGKEPGDISDYKRIVLKYFPKIIESTVDVPRLSKSIEPFHGWNSGPLVWWDAYNKVKHSRGEHFFEASYINATTAMSALYILIFYLAKINEFEFNGCKSIYIVSDYASPYLIAKPSKELPDFA